MLRNLLSERERELPASRMAKLIKIAEESKDIISLGPGEPDFIPPEPVLNFIKKDIEKYTHYSPPQGSSELKRALLKKLKNENKISASSDNIIVTSGSTESILLALMCIIDPGEAVMLTDPGFLSYKPTVEVLNGMPISIPLHEKDGFQLDIDTMKDLVVPEKTKAVIINTPNNPCGVVYKKKLLEEIAEFAMEYDLLIISDEAYEKFLYDNAKHISIASLNGMENHTMSLFTFSKTYAMTGFRVGYAVGPEKIIKSMTKLHLYTSICSPTISQAAAVEALKYTKYFNKILREYNKRRKFIIKRLKEMGIMCAKPEGAFYVFPNITKFKMDSIQFSEFLLKKAKVAVTPGTEFGKHGEGFVRMSYATDYDKIVEAMDRIEKVIKKL